MVEIHQDLGPCQNQNEGAYFQTKIFLYSLKTGPDVEWLHPGEHSPELSGTDHESIKLKLPQDLMKGDNSDNRNSLLILYQQGQDFVGAGGLVVPAHHASLTLRAAESVPGRTLPQLPQKVALKCGTQIVGACKSQK